MKGKIVIDNKLCKGCGFCVTACPKGLIVSNNDSGVVYHADAEKCNGCGLCAVICPDIAIEVWREDGSINSPSRAKSRENYGKK